LNLNLQIGAIVEEGELGILGYRFVYASEYLQVVFNCPLVAVEEVLTLVVVKHFPQHAAIVGHY
jgi:hypothetical protein